MAVLKDYKCPTHGFFESFDPVCPHGCTEVSVVFLQAPGMISDKTKGYDGTLQNLSHDFKMTDIKSTREGENQSGYFNRNNTNETNPVMWGQQANKMNPNMNMDSLFKSNAYDGAGFNPKALGNLPQPKPGIVMKDHENLKVPE
jgi:hypothetical protein